MIAKAIALLHRWLAHDEENLDETLDDETNDLLLAYSVPRAEHEQAVLDACARLDLRVDPAGNVTCYGGGREVELLEHARRQAKAAADAARREMLEASPELRERARSALRRLDSLR